MINIIIPDYTITFNIIIWILIAFLSIYGLYNIIIPFIPMSK